MKTRWIVRIALFLVCVFVFISDTSTLNISHKPALDSHNCPIGVADPKLDGIDVSGVPFSTYCYDTATNGQTTGVTYMPLNQIVLQYPKGTSVATIEKAAVHEHIHLIDYYSDSMHRAVMYDYLNIYLNPQSNTYHDSLIDSTSKNYQDWLHNAHERLAESVVQCLYGTPNRNGMQLVDKAACTPFLETVETAANSIHK